MDVSEVGLDPLAGEMAQGDEGLRALAAVAAEIALDLGVAAGVAELVAEPAVDLGGGVPLLGWGALVVGEDLVDRRLEGTELGRRPVAEFGDGFGILEGLSDGDAGEAAFAGDPPDGLAIAVGPPDGTIVIQSKHILDPP